MVALRHSGDSPRLPYRFANKSLARWCAAGRMRHKDGKLATRAISAQVNDYSPAQRIHADPQANPKGECVKSRLAGALCRAALIAVVITTPLILLADVPINLRQSTLIAAMVCALVTFLEYNARVPSFIEFRDAPPLNRYRAMLLLASLLGLSLLAMQQSHPTELGSLITAIATVTGESLDFPYSPVRLTLLVLDDTATRDTMVMLRQAAGLALLIGAMFISHFALVLRLANWPRPQRPFNLWVNLPTFDSGARGDIARRLERDAWTNMLLGITLPFVLPLVVSLGYSGISSDTLAEAYNMVWLITLWAFVPTSLIMRGMALNRIAAMIRNAQRSRAEAQDSAKPSRLI